MYKNVDMYFLIEMINNLPFTIYLFIILINCLFIYPCTCLFYFIFCIY